MKTNTAQHVKRVCCILLQCKQQKAGGGYIQPPNPLPQAELFTHTMVNGTIKLSIKAGREGGTGGKCHELLFFSTFSIVT